VDAAGNVWVVNAGREIWRYSNGWQVMPGGGLDLSAGPDGAVYAVGTASGTGGNEIWRWSGSSWIRETGVYGTAIAAGSGLHAWVARSAGLPVILR